MIAAAEATPTNASATSSPTPVPTTFLGTLVPMFSLGSIHATTAALAALEESGESALYFLGRHITGGWMDQDRYHRDANLLAASRQGEVNSTYELRTGVRLRITTEAGHSRTVLHIADEA